MKVLYYLLGLFFMTSFGCNNSGSNAAHQEHVLNFDKLIYQYTDASVAPDVHRSYKIEVSDTLIEHLVHSYVDTISFVLSAFAEKDFELLKAEFRSSEIDSCVDNKEPICSGGTSIGIKLVLKNEIVFDHSVYRCGGKNYGSLCGEYERIGIFLNNRLPKQH